MIQAIAFDLDKTLADLEKAINNNIVEILQSYEKKNIKIIICSGKPTYYLSGLVRQLSLVNPILIGENGAVVQLGIALPPIAKFLKFDNKARILITKMREELITRFGDSLWMQPNEVCLTCFFKDEKTRNGLSNYLNEQFADDFVAKMLNKYEHIDSFDICPVGIDKGNAIKYLAEMYQIDLSKIVAVGNDINDYPMFEIVGTSIGIGINEKEKVTFLVNNISEAIERINNIMQVTK